METSEYQSASVSRRDDTTSINDESTRGGFNRFQQALNQAVPTQPAACKALSIALLSKGHVLIEDAPGMGKTILCKWFAKLSGLQTKRIQFTSDLLPADVLGGAVFKRAGERFVFKPGPIFTELMLADEINRASPKSQSALLEAMEERRVSVDGHTYALPEPFIVVATQNSLKEHGTLPLPQSEMDRFLMRISLEYPEPAQESQLLNAPNVHHQIESAKPVAKLEDIVAWQKAVEAVDVPQTVCDYLVALLNESRHSVTDWIHTDSQGLSPRSGRYWMQAAKAHAWLSGRDYVICTDIMNTAVAVTNHRFRPDWRPNHPDFEVCLANWFSRVKPPR